MSRTDIASLKEDIRPGQLDEIGARYQNVPFNHPLIFHCSVGKDRTGVLAAMLLAAAGVIDEDIVHDYTLSAPFIPEIRERFGNDPAAAAEVKALPGSASGYLEAQGADRSLPRRLQEALLVS
jgi:hypothetical protein